MSERPEIPRGESEIIWHPCPPSRSWLRLKRSFGVELTEGEQLVVDGKYRP